MSSNLYKLNLKSLKDGEHIYSDFLDKDFFQGIEDSLVREGEFEYEVVLTKRGGLHQLNITVEGYVVLDCDRCLAPLEVDVYSERDLVVKFGAEYSEESDEVLIIPEAEGVLDLRWLIYEEIVLALPMQRMHEEGECDSSMMQHYQAISTDRPAEGQDGVERDDEGIDQRWAALKQLKKQ